MTQQTSPQLAAYEGKRRSLLQQIIQETAQDTRFAAAWLTGSFGRGEQDAVSDLDLNLLTTESGAALLADRALRGGTSPARRTLFEQFGDPLVIHENPHNVTPGGSFSVVVYRSGHAVDWALHAPELKFRPFASRLLFDHVGVTVKPPPPHVSLAASTERLVERWEFFWMMACVTAKYWVRSDDVLVVVMLDQLHRIGAEIAGFLAEEQPVYRSSSLVNLPPTPSEQAHVVHQLCREVEALYDTIAEHAGALQPSGYPPVKAIMQLRAHS